jgi:peptidoglycan/xylan/chitin deacetylase (PgdA/CDA1 family)
MIKLPLPAQSLGIAVLLAISIVAPSAHADAHTDTDKVVEPGLKISARPGVPTVALTFDACMGAVDHRILDTLVAQRIPATIFVTARWLRKNPEAYAVMRSNPDLFELENHGEMHVPAVDKPMKIYGIAAAGSPDAVAREVRGGAEALLAAGSPQPRWFRGATAKYSTLAINQIRAMGYRIAGYSVNGDGGSLLGASVSERRIATAHDGDIVLAHINQPTHAAGEGVVRGILALKERGFRFVRLDEVSETDLSQPHI